MFCIKCGSENSDEAMFCQKCGHKFDFLDEEETQIARSLEDEFEEIDEDDEEDIFSINPTLLFVKIGYGVAVLAAFFLVAFIATISSLLTSPISAIAVVTVGLSMLLIPAYFHVKQKMVRYTLTDSKVEIDRGLINKTTRNVPLRIIQDVTVTANVSQRMFGLGNLEIENANESDDKIILKNINSPKEHAKILLKQMRRLNK